MIKSLRASLLLFLMMIGFCSESRSCESVVAENSSIVKAMRNAITRLNGECSFSAIDLRFFQEELLCINTLKIRATKNYKRFGELYLLKEELPVFLRSIGNDDEHVIYVVTEMICRIVCAVKEACNKDSAWICVRAFLPTAEFDIPRWHTDGYYYSPYAGFAVKFATALQGRQTIFYPLPHSMREQFYVCKDDRAALNKLLDYEKSKSATQGQGVFFIVGDKNYAAVHSEPAVKEERLFLSVLPGNKEEIEELYSNWHPSFLKCTIF
jgi:hypothetical protein